MHRLLDTRTEFSFAPRASHFIIGDFHARSQGTKLPQRSPILPGDSIAKNAKYHRRNINGDSANRVSTCGLLSLYLSPQKTLRRGLQGGLCALSRILASLSEETKDRNIGSAPWRIGCDMNARNVAL